MCTAVLTAALSNHWESSASSKLCWNHGKWGQSHEASPSQRYMEEPWPTDKEKGRIAKMTKQREATREAGWVSLIQKAEMLQNPRVVELLTWPPRENCVWPHKVVCSQNRVPLKLPIQLPSGNVYRCLWNINECFTLGFIFKISCYAYANTQNLKKSQNWKLLIQRTLD